MWSLVWTLVVVPGALGLASVRDSLTQPVHAYEGDDALVTCVVRGAGDNTVLWKKEDRERHSLRVLTAGDARVTADRRFHVLHDDVTSEERITSGGDVWVLVINDAKPTDSGIYVCEVNSNPIVRSFHKLSVLSRALQPPENQTEVGFLDNTQRSDGLHLHNYTDCCMQKNVSHSCLGFCNIQSIMDGNTGQDPENCESDFPAIVRCMADGRNHVPCCIRQGVPDICQDVCRGEYTMITDNIKTHFSCSSYTEITLLCIVEGVELLPSRPDGVEVEALTEHSLQVSWKPPTQNSETVVAYHVNVKKLKEFDQDMEYPDDSAFHELDSYHIAAVTASSGMRITTESYSVSTSVRVASSPQPNNFTLKVPGTYNSTIVNDLMPYTMYEVTVTAFNIHGSSLPSYSLRALTLTPGKIKPNGVADSPKLPDIRSCCVEKGVSHTTCLNRLCDPLLSDVAEVTDFMICAPWANATFACLTNGMDHTPCCRARGLPDICQELCSGNITQLDYSYFKCLKYMGDYTNCLLQGYGVLPSAPQKVFVSNIETTFAILHWDPPKTLGETVTFYNVKYRMLPSMDPSYHTFTNIKTSPYILEGLDSETDYEIYVEAANAHGVGEGSTHIVFSTESKIVEEKIEEASFYNVTACCVDADLSEVCMPLCSYDASMADIKSLAGSCARELPKLLRCGAGGRNHVPCCSRRGVPNKCQSLCSGVIVESLVVTATSCIPFIGNIVQCFEEGTGLLPAPINEFYASEINDTSVTLTWQPPSEGNVTMYIIYYKKINNTSIQDTLMTQEMQHNTTETTDVITNLETNNLYKFYVVAGNEHGTSLPSSVLMINITKTDLSGSKVPGVTSPPHSLTVSAHSATWVAISWQPPEYSLPSESIVYRLYYKAAADDSFQNVETSVTSRMIEGLKPNSQYIVYVTAVSKKGPSLPSETLIAWTDPAYPAYVEPPTVHPINLVIEGSSMTILCIAMGTPLPTISLYISGRLIHQETSRHMVTVVHNVTRNMDQISCYADNGYGTPMQASRKITISYPPHITASGITMAALGDSVVLECQVDAHPEPKTMFWKDHNGRVPVIQGGKYDISVQRIKDEENRYIMRLTIHGITTVDEGDFFCHAENAFGTATQPVSVRIRNVAATNNVTQCCIEQNVTNNCMMACSFYLDIDAVIDKPECINEFDKLMKCAADGSDHRTCCAQYGVPRRCLDWCRGEPLFNNKLCVLSYTKQIMSCFHEGRESLPGPPQNVQIEAMDANTVMVSWDPPVKNPHTVEIYRIIWRPIGSRTALKNDTKATSIKITGLKYGETYEYMIKAGNTHGTSTLTEPKQFTASDKYITTSANIADSTHVGVAIGVVLSLIVVAAIVAGTIWLLRSKRLLGRKSSGGVAFENPSYLREVNMDHIQIPPHQGDSVLPNGNGLANGVNPASGQGWKQETLHVPQATEVAPTLYEELKLGQDGAGFKRLK